MPKIGHREHGVAQRARAVALREAGLPYARIGEQLGISRQAAYKHVQRALSDLTKRTAEGAERVRQLELRRLDALLAANWAKRGGQIIVPGQRQQRGAQDLRDRRCPTATSR